MRILSLVFVVMALYGLFTENKGAGLIAAGMAVFVLYAARVFERQDQAFLQSPNRAKSPRNSGDELRSKDCETY